MISAPRLSTNSARKIHSDHQPRLCALNSASRRWLRGDNCISGLPAFEIDARVDQGVGQVADQLPHQYEQGEEAEGDEHHRVVAVDCRLDAEQYETHKGAEHLDQQRDQEAVVWGTGGTTR